MSDPPLIASRSIRGTATGLILAACLMASGCSVFNRDKADDVRELRSEPILQGVPGWKKRSERSTTDFAGAVRASSSWDSRTDAAATRREFQGHYAAAYPSLRWRSAGPGGGGSYYGRTPDGRASVRVGITPDPKDKFEGALVFIEVRRG